MCSSDLSSAVTLTIPLATDKTINSLRFDNVASSTLSLSAGNTLTVGTGGIVMWSTNSQFIGATSGVGNLTSGTSELFVEAQGSGWHYIRTNIVGSGMAFITNGSGTLQLEGTNTYDGGTYVNQGTLVISPYGGGEIGRAHV